MKDILKLDKCPVSGLKIITKPEWRYEVKDGSFKTKIAVIGDNILYEAPIGMVNKDASNWYRKTANKIIAEFFGEKKFYLIYDYSLTENASLVSKKIFYNWLLSHSDKIELISIFGMNKLMKVVINTATAISIHRERLLLTDSYKESITAFLQKQIKLVDNKELGTKNNFTNDKKTENTRINELIGYLGNMTWSGNLNQKIPVLLDEDPFAELFAAVAINQEDLREMENDRNEAYKKLEKLIVEKNKALEELSAKEILVQNSEEYHRTLIENSIDAISVIDINGDFISISKSVEKISGYTNEELKRKNAFALLLPPDREKMMQVLKEIKEDYGSIRNLEFRIYHENGSIRHIEGTAKNMLHSPAVKGIVLNYRDVTQQVKQQNLLKQSEEYHRTLIENSIDAISVIDINGDFVSISKSAEKISGYTNEERKRKNIFTLMLPDDRKKMMRILEEIKENYDSVTITAFRIYHKDGSIRSIEGTAKNMLHSPIVKGIVLNYRDVTERKTNERKIKRREAYLHALNKISERPFKTNSIKELQNFVEIIGVVASASRTYIFKKHKKQNNEPLLSQLVEYVAEGIKPEINNPDLQNMGCDDWFPRWEKSLQNGEIIKGKVSDFPVEERLLFRSQEIRSLIVIPIFVEKTFWGLLGFDNCVNNKEWNDNDIKYFKIATKRLENSIELVEKQKILEAENKRFKITMDAMNNGVYVADMQNYELLFLNKFFIDLFGDKTGKKCYKTLQGLDEPCSFCTNKHLLNENKKPNQVYIWEFQNRITKRWYQLRDHAIRWMDGRMVRMEVAVDITEQKEVNKQITKLSTAIEQTANAIVITDTKGNIEYTNPQYTKTTGYTAEEVQGKNPQFLNAGTLPDDFHAKIWKTLEKGEAWSGEFHNKSKSGRFYWESATITPIKENGEIISFLSVQQDITKQKESAKKIRKLSQVVKTTSQSVIITDIEGIIVFINEALIKTGGFDKESEIIGKSIYTYTNEQDVAKLKDEILPDTFIKGFYHGEINLIKKDNTIYPAEINASIIKDEAGKPELIVAMFSDISERKQTEKHLIAAKEKAEESNRLKTAFLNNMSHEIRTPLNGITGFLELLQDPDTEEEERQKFTKIINKSSNRLIDTVTDIIEVSKIEAGLINLSVKEVSVNGMLQELYDFFSLEAKNKGLELKCIPSLSEDESIIITDNHKLNGILTNLLKNAIKFTDRGSVTFGYIIETDTLRFFVKDTGIGIPKHRQHAVFNRFEQADIEDEKAFEGSGLGLAIAKSYVKILGGEIWYKTKKAIGTEFMFTIPYRTKTNKTKKKNQAKESKKQKANFIALTVLIAEDEKVNKQFFETIFKNTFKQTIYVRTGQEALEACRKNSEIDLILMDIRMPLMNGFTATREIRKFNKDIIIIAQTAFGLEGDNEKALEAGCNDYIAKPINKKELFEKIKLHSLKQSINTNQTENP